MPTPKSRNAVSAAGDNRSNSPTARAAPTHIEAPPTTTRTSAETRRIAPCTRLRSVVAGTRLFTHDTLRCHNGHRIIHS